MPLISVIVPVYKVEPYLHRCVDSILAQTFTDFELILVDDGTPDNCGVICDEYAQKDSRIHVIHQQNGGLSAARNAGIDWAFANSDSQWLSFVDSDDWVHPQYLEFLYRAVAESGAGASVCIYSTENAYRPNKMIETAGWKGYSFEDFFCLRQTGVHSIVAWAKLYKKSLYLNKRYPVGKINEDLFITPKVLYECSFVAVTDATLYYYFQSDDSIMRRPWSIRRLDEIEGSEELIRFLHMNKAYKAERYAIQRYFWVLDRQKKEIESLPKKNEKIRRHLNWKCKKALVRFRSIFPFKEFKYEYEIAFPKLMWCYWVCVGKIKKIKRMVKRNA